MASPNQGHRAFSLHLAPPLAARVVHAAPVGLAVVFAADQNFANVSLAGNASISDAVPQPPAPDGGGNIVATGSPAPADGSGSSATPTPTPAPAPTAIPSPAPARTSTPISALAPTPTPAPVPPARPVVLALTAAGYVRDGAYARTNFAAEPLLVVKRGPAGYTREKFLTFDLSQIGAIHTARLRLFGRLTLAARKGAQVRVYAASGTVIKGQLNWKNRPIATGAALATATVAGTQSRWYDWDLSAFLKAQRAAGKSSVTLALRGVSPADAAALFDGGKVGRGPQLVVS